MTATTNADSLARETTFDAADTAYVNKLGWDEVDGEQVFRAVLVFPSGPPSFSYDVVWKQLPVSIALVPSAAPGWQPIETAPKDGTRLILGFALAESSWVGEGYYHVGDCNWYEANTDPTDSWSDSCSPTHWRPLPAPPASDLVRSGEPRP